MIIKIDPVKQAEKTKADYTAALQKRLDDFAQSGGYTNCLYCCTYATSANSKFASEGQYMVDARDATWVKCYEIIDDVGSGARPIPTLDELFAELPVLAWPSSIAF